MSQQEKDITVHQGADDSVLPFAVEGLDVRGRVVRLGDAIDLILSRHDYPAAVARVVGEAAALTALLGSALKFNGQFQLQSRSDGPIEMIVVDFDAPDRLRACARFDADRLREAEATGNVTTGALLGKGHLALTVDQGADMVRYQGIVALEGEGLEEAAHAYFRQSEQIPTRVRLAVGEELLNSGDKRQMVYRAGGMLVQFLPQAGGSVIEAQRDDMPLAENSDVDDRWQEAHLLVNTVEDHELIDSTVSSERLLFRLFHERGVRVFDAQPVFESCRCNHDRILSMLVSFSDDDRQHMIGDNGRIGVTCEFCSRHYDINPLEVGIDTAKSKGNAS